MTVRPNMAAINMLPIDYEQNYDVDMVDLLYK